MVGGRTDLTGFTVHSRDRRPHVTFPLVSRSLLREIRCPTVAGSVRRAGWPTNRPSTLLMRPG